MSAEDTRKKKKKKKTFKDYGSSSKVSSNVSYTFPQSQALGLTHALLKANEIYNLDRYGFSKCHRGDEAAKKLADEREDRWQWTSENASFIQTGVEKRGSEKFGKANLGKEGNMNERKETKKGA